MRHWQDWPKCNSTAPREKDVRCLRLVFICTWCLLFEGRQGGGPPRFPRLYFEVSRINLVVPFWLEGPSKGTFVFELTHPPFHPLWVQGNGRIGVRFCPWYEKVMQEPSLSPSFNCVDASHSAHDECGIDDWPKCNSTTPREKDVRCLRLVFICTWCLLFEGRQSGGFSSELVFGHTGILN